MLHFVNKLKGGVIPSEFIPAIEAGLREEAKSGGRTGYPLVDLRVTLTDGAFHEVDSSDLAYRFAASDALRKAVEEAGPVLLEPIMRIEVVTPEDYLGNVTGDLSSRRALIDRTSTRGKLMVIDARAPSRRCSATRPPCAASARAAPATPWSRWNTPRAREPARGADVMPKQSAGMIDLVLSSTRRPHSDGKRNINFELAGTPGRLPQTR